MLHINCVGTGMFLHTRDSLLFFPSLFLPLYNKRIIIKTGSILEVLLIENIVSMCGHVAQKTCGG